MSNYVSPEWAIRAQILCDVLDLPQEQLSVMNQDSIEELWDTTEENRDFDLWDTKYEFRSSGCDTNLNAPLSRHYEADQVAASTPFGWVSWTYWYGGGKHGNPEEIDWIEHAFYVSVEEEEVTIIQRTFTKVE